MPSTTTFLGRAIGGVVNPVVHNLDVDDIVERIDINALLDRVDLTELLSEKIDLNHVLDRVDMDRILDRVDVNKIIDRSNLGEIVARSSSGVFGHLLDALRSQSIWADQVAQGWGRLSCCRGSPNRLPPRPRSVSFSTKQKEEDVCPRGTSELALAAQGRNAGIVSRIAAFCIDRAIVVGSYTLSCFFVVLVLELVVNRLKKEVQEDVYKWEGWPFLAGAILYSWNVFYEFCLMATIGRTIGKVLLGLLVVTANGKRLPVHQAFVRAVATSIPPFVVVSSWIGLVRKDRRQCQDLVGCTTVVYAWDARQLRLRERGLTAAEQMGHHAESLADRNV